MRFIGKHPILLVFVLVVLVIAGFTVKTYLASGEQSQRRGSGVTPVVTAPVRVEVIVDQVESIGTAVANESVVLTAKLTETVSKVHFEDGDFVEAGDILVELTNSEETAQLAEAQANVDETSRQYERVRNLIKQKLASETQLDIEKARMQTAEARLNAIVARLNDRLIRAPFDGVLGFRQISPGTLLTPQTPVTTLDDISVMKVDFSVPEGYLAVIHRGQEVLASSRAYTGKMFEGKVNTINSRIDPATRTMTVRADLNNDEKLLRPGMLLTIKLIQERSEVVTVPEAAVIPVQDKQFVYVVINGIAERREITVGRRVPGLVEVLAGVAVGEEVITQGVIKIRPGSPVEVRR